MLSVFVEGMAQQWTLRPGDTLSIGRSDERDITLPHNSVSRRHASLGWTRGGAPWIRDENSTNGVFVDDVQVSAKTSLEVGQVVDLGKFSLRLERSGALLEDSGVLTLFDSQEPLESGTVTSARDVEEILLHHGDLQRTGTLVFKLGKTTAELQFYEGNIVSAKVGKLRGESALKLLEGIDRAGAWHFFSRVTLVEDDQVDVSTRRWVDTMRLKRMKRPE